jgi:GT2 family glycosyltransferase
MFGTTQIDGRRPDRLDGCGDAYSFLGLPWRGCYGHSVEAIAPEGEAFAPCAAAALYRRDVLESMAGFDETFFCYCEDVDLAFRIRLQGGVCVQIPDAVVHHIGSAITGSESHFTLHHSARNRVWLMLKNLPFGLLVLLFPLHLTYMALTLWVHRRRKGPYFSATLTGLRAAFSGAGPILKARRLIQRNRKASTIEIARMLCWSPSKLQQRASDIRPLGRRA